MSFKIKEGVSTEGLPQVTLGSLVLFVPRVKLRHRIAIAAQMAKVKASSDKFKNEGGSATVTEDDLLPVIEVIRQGLLGLYPDVTAEDILDADCGIEDLNAAIPVITKQSASRRAGEAKAGEEEATSSTTSSSGEGSSLN